MFGRQDVLDRADRACRRARELVRAIRLALADARAYAELRSRRESDNSPV